MVFFNDVDSFLYSSGLKGWTEQNVVFFWAQQAVSLGLGLELSSSVSGFGLQLVVVTRNSCSLTSSVLLLLSGRLQVLLSLSFGLEKLVELRVVRHLVSQSKTGLPVISCSGWQAAKCKINNHQVPVFNWNPLNLDGIQRLLIGLK